jgi:hypothetical protein
MQLDQPQVTFQMSFLTDCLNMWDTALETLMPLIPARATQQVQGHDDAGAFSGVGTTMPDLPFVLQVCLSSNSCMQA